MFVDPLDGAAAGARLHERAVVFIPPAQPARFGEFSFLLRCHWGRAKALCECDCARCFVQAVLEWTCSERPPENLFSIYRTWQSILSSVGTA